MAVPFGIKIIDRPISQTQAGLSTGWFMEVSRHGLRTEFTCQTLPDAISLRLSNICTADGRQITDHATWKFSRPSQSSSWPHTDAQRFPAVSAGAQYEGVFFAFGGLLRVELVPLETALFIAGVRLLVMEVSFREHCCPTSGSIWTYSPSLATTLDKQYGGEV
jgi:hypothetical protein